MKDLLVISTLFFLFVLVSCEKDDVMDNPEWVDQWIIEIESNDNCINCEIYRYEYQGEYYYELFSPIFSCLPCQVHYADGTMIDSTFNVRNYVEDRTNKKVIYKKK